MNETPPLTPEQVDDWCRESFANSDWPNGDRHFTLNLRDKIVSWHEAANAALIAERDALKGERDRETELRREAEAHAKSLQEALSVKPYADEYDDLEAQLAASQAEAARLRDGLRGLAAEVAGLIDFAEQALRAAVGNTNVQALQVQLRVAHEALMDASAPAEQTPVAERRIDQEISVEAIDLAAINLVAMTADQAFKLLRDSGPLGRTVRLRVSTFVFEPAPTPDDQEPTR